MRDHDEKTLVEKRPSLAVLALLAASTPAHATLLPVRIVAARKQSPVGKMATPWGRREIDVQTERTAHTRPRTVAVLAFVNATGKDGPGNAASPRTGPK